MQLRGQEKEDQNESVSCSWRNSGEQRSEGALDFRGQDTRENGASER